MEEPSDRPGATILIVDDNPANLAVLTHALAERGFRILVDQRGESAIQTARRVHPDLVLLDVQLPGLDGFEICRRLKADPLTAAIAVLFMTVRMEGEDKLRGFAAGAVDYITKPLQIEEVLARVTTHVRLHQLARSLTRQNAQLQAAKLALREANEQLERRVRERTAELVRVNLDLQQQVGERQRAEAALVSERNLLRTLIDSLPDRIYVKDAQGRFVLVNAATLAYHHAGGPEDLLGKTDADIFAADQAARLRAFEEAVALSGQPLLNQEVTDVDPRTGAATWMLVTKVPVRSAGGRLTGIVGVHHDITLRRRLEAQFIQAQKMEAIGRLAGGVAHDFNNLLTVISGYVELARDTLTPDDPLYEDLQAIHDATDRAAALVRQLLVFARRQVLEPRSVWLNDLVANVEKLLRRVIGEDIELVVVPGRHIWPVKADPTQLEQVLINMAINARDSMPGGGRLTIAIANAHLEGGAAQKDVAAPPGAYVTLAVSDTGSGIAPDILPRIFEPFFTTKEIGKGTGLGLATCYGIVKQHGGHIWVASEVGQGTTFTIYLPAAAEGGGELPLSAEQELLPGGSGTLLLVEDELAVRQLAARVLRDLGYNVLEAGDGADALRVAALHGAEIDLLLTDVVMPFLGGEALAERVREIYPQIRVIFMSGYSDRLAGEGRALPGDAAFIQKPFTPRVLAHTIRDVLAHELR